MKKYCRLNKKRKARQQCRNHYGLFGVPILLYQTHSALLNKFAKTIVKVVLFVECKIGLYKTRQTCRLVRHKFFNRIYGQTPLVYFMQCD